MHDFFSKNEMKDFFVKIWKKEIVVMDYLTQIVDYYYGSLWTYISVHQKYEPSSLTFISVHQKYEPIMSHVREWTCERGVHVHVCTSLLYK